MQLDGDGVLDRDIFIVASYSGAYFLQLFQRAWHRVRRHTSIIIQFERDAVHWLEPMRKWIQEAQMLEEIAKSKDYPSKKSSLQKIFGSNLTLHAREARGVPQNQWFPLL